jgi:hypothetical protein
MEVVACQSHIRRDRLWIAGDKSPPAALSVDMSSGGAAFVNKRAPGQRQPDLMAGSVDNFIKV